MQHPPPTENAPFGRFALLGALLFIATIALPLVNMGFRSSHSGAPVADAIHFSSLQVWAMNLALGGVAGALWVPQRFVLATVAGLAGAAVVTGTALLYFSWRESVEVIETLIPLGLGTFASHQLYLFASARFPVDSGP